MECYAHGHNLIGNRIMWRWQQFIVILPLSSAFGWSEKPNNYPLKWKAIQNIFFKNG